MDVLGHGLAGRTMAHMKHRHKYLLSLSLFFGLWSIFQAHDSAHASATPKVNGIQPLIPLEARTLHEALHEMIPKKVRPLLLPQELEHFLQELEGGPPDWAALQDKDHTQQSEHLFQLNRSRDEARGIHKDLLQQPLAFVWSGMLRKYLPEYQGFSVALGPEFTTTSWGVVRFKPMGLPDYLVAIPSPEVKGQLLMQQKQGKQIDIIVVWIGRLAPEESLIYDFSHEEEGEGMVMPVVLIQDVKYFLKFPRALGGS